MAFYLSRRSLMSLSSLLLHRNLHQHQHQHQQLHRRICMLVSWTSTNLEAAERLPPRSNSSHLLQWFRFTGSLPYQMKYGEIRRDGKIYQFDNNHWVVNVRFEEYEEEIIRREEMVEIYVGMGAKVFGSVDEAKNRIYSYCTTDCYNYCFRVECSKDTSRLFRGLPGVCHVGPDHWYLKPEFKKHKRLEESKKRQKQIAESNKHRKRICKKRVICRSIQSAVPAGMPKLK